MRSMPGRRDPRRECREISKAVLKQDLREHIREQGCFHCGSSEALQVSHFRPKAIDETSPQQKVCFVVKANRNTTTLKYLKDLQRCGILCHDHHLQYDHHYKHGGPMVSWDAEYNKKGWRHWRQWYREYLCLSEDCDVETAAFLAA